MFFALLLLFILIPVIEIALLIEVGSMIGTGNTIAVIFLTAVIGAYMVKHEGLGVMYRIQQNMNQGTFPAEEMIDGMMILVSGALLLTPGFFTDTIGFLMVIPFTRALIKGIARRVIEKKISSGDIRINRF
jgi:UPF0716 protein FxsA